MQLLICRNEPNSSLWHCSLSYHLNIFPIRDSPERSWQPSHITRSKNLIPTQYTVYSIQYSSQLRVWYWFIFLSDVRPFLTNSYWTIYRWICKQTSHENPECAQMKSRNRAIGYRLNSDNNLVRNDPTAGYHILLARSLQHMLWKVEWNGSISTQLLEAIVICIFFLNVFIIVFPMI